jgi:hypothetical protein
MSMNVSRHKNHEILDHADIVGGSELKGRHASFGSMRVRKLNYSSHRTSSAKPRPVWSEFGHNVEDFENAAVVESIRLVCLVPEEGLEPSRGLTPPDFESGASAIPPLRHVRFH